MLISTAIGAAAALGSAAYGAIKSSQANKKAGKLIQDERDANRRWYDYNMASDYTSRTDAQAVINKQRELLNEQYRNARATNVVAGGSDESLAAQKEAANEAMSNTMTNIAADASSHKDNVEAQYRQTDAQLNQQQAALEQQKAQNIANAAGQAVNAGIGLMGMNVGQPVIETATQPVQPVVNSGQQKLQNDITNSKGTALNNTIKEQFVAQPVKKVELKTR